MVPSITTKKLRDLQVRLSSRKCPGALVVGCRSHRIIADVGNAGNPVKVFFYETAERLPATSTPISITRDERFTAAAAGDARDRGLTLIDVIEPRWRRNPVPNGPIKARNIARLIDFYDNEGRSGSLLTPGMGM
jgi:hypothetical protein